MLLKTSSLTASLSSLIVEALPGVNMVLTVSSIVLSGKEVIALFLSNFIRLSVALASSRNDATKACPCSLAFKPLVLFLFVILLISFLNC